jgi:hypothetical protein
MNKINEYGMRSGIVKIIPPKEWIDNQPNLNDIIKTIKVREPIKQDIMGTAGTYRQANILHQRSYNLPQWRQLCDQSEHQPPAKRGERRANQDKITKPTRPAPKKVATSSAANGPKKRGPGRPFKKQKAQHEEEETGQDRLPTPTSPSIAGEDKADIIKLEPDLDEGTPTPARIGGRQAKVSVSSRRKYSRREAAGMVDEAAFENFNYKMDISEYTPERCAELERTYWKTLTYAPPLYGADMLGSLFDDRTTTWNLGNLPNLLDVMGTKIPGVNTAYLYLGMWKATFAWHLEDVDLYSINYLHFGAPKQWYSIAQKDARKFEAAMKSIWPTDAKACDQFLRHKTFLISPSTLLANYGIKANKITHFPGEFVVTYPYGYHSGFNMGYNCAEAVNFALPSWLSMGRIAKKCDCSQAQDSVWIDVAELERKMRGEETDYEETDEEDEEDEDEDGPTDLPTPPDSSGDNKLRKPIRKRKRVSEKDAKPAAKRLRIRMKISNEPCCLCPNDIKTEPLIPTECGRKAHRMCAEYTPETDIETGGSGAQLVINTMAIGKDRLDLKCVFCHSRKGAKIQCSQKKCTRSYHATCAAAAGMFIEIGETGVFGEDGTEYKKMGIEFSCRFHRVKRDKKLDYDTLDDDARIRSAGKAAKVKDICQFQFPRKEIFAGVVVDNRESEEMLIVDILPNGSVFTSLRWRCHAMLTLNSDRFEVEYKYLLIPDPADFHLPKPSDKAIPMPTSRKAKESLVTTKRQVDDLPRKDDLFVENFTWAEFNPFDPPKNPEQVKIDFSKERQIFFYLGKKSTEARAQYTANITKPVYDPRCNFLDTIVKPASAASLRQSFPASYPSSYNHQHALNAVRGPIRPSIPKTPSSLSKSSKPDKPYVYKPRSNSDTYHVDTQAYRSQQTFLKQSAIPSMPYTFGSDPSYRQPDARSPVNPYNHGYSTPQFQHNQTSQASTPAKTSYSSSSSSILPPPKASYSYGNKPVSGKGSTHQSRLSNGNTTFQDPFRKYPYLQREHNKSPLDYKTPYSPNGGFMNGYEGDLKAYLMKNPDALFKISRQTMSTVSNYSNSYASNPLLAQSSGQNSQKTYAPILPPPRAYTSAALPTYQNNQAAQKQQQSFPQQQVTKPVGNNGNAWEKKDSSLHPAIRQDYGGSTMFHTHYAPVSSINGASRPQNNQSVPPRTVKETPIYPPGYSRPQQPQESTGQSQSPPQAQPQSQYSPTCDTSAQSRSSPQSSFAQGLPPKASPPSYAQLAAHQPQGLTQPRISETYQSPVIQSPYASSYHANQVQRPPQLPSYQDGKPLYAHQQYFHGHDYNKPQGSVQQDCQHQKPTAAPASMQEPPAQAQQPAQQAQQSYQPQQAQQPRYAQPPQEQAQMKHNDIADLPPDSSSLVEQMMANLKRATAGAGSR